MGLVSELRRRNVLRMVVLYVVAAWLIMQVADVLVGLEILPTWIGPAIFGLLAVGFPIALIFSWFYELTPEGLSLEKDVEPGESITHVTGRRLDFLVISLLCAAVILFAYDKWWIAPPPEQSIAVLPFENMSGDPEQEYFSDGLSDTLIHVLAQVSGLKVTAKTSSFYFKGQNIDVGEIARQLNVGTILEGSVQKAGNRVRVIAQLVNAADGTHLWSKSFDRELEDIFAIQDEISGHIVQALKVVLGGGEMEAMAHAQKPTEDLQAYELYLRGRYFWQRRGEDNIRRAIDLFERATALDPQFARAWSSLAAAHWTLPTYSDLTQAERQPLAVSAAQKALALDDSLAEAYAVLGDVAYAMDEKWADAEAYFLRAIAHEPTNATAHLWYGELLRSVGRIRDSLEETLIAYQLDPMNPGTNNVLAGTYLRLDDISNVLKYGTAAWDLGHMGGLYYLTAAHLRLEEFDQAIDFAGQFDELAIFPVGITTLYVEAKMDAAKRPLFLKALAEHENVLPSYFSLAGYVGFGRMDDAYRVVNMNRGDSEQYWRPEFAPFRQDPRFENLVAKQGLLDYWREYGWPDDCRPEGDSLSCE